MDDVEARSILLVCQICSYYILSADRGMMKRLTVETVADAIAEHYLAHGGRALVQTEVSYRPKEAVHDPKSR